MIDVITGATWFIKIVGTLFFMILPIVAFAKKAYLRTGVIAVLSAGTMWLLWEPTAIGTNAILHIQERAFWLALAVILFSPLCIFLYKQQERELTRYRG